LLYSKSRAAVGSWIKDSYRNDRSLGFVMQIDDETSMMYVQYPKTGKSTWMLWENNGQYMVINN
tara:strand:+ start:195 stop:386 length:192 start_codon:yes stop_codon:yes gene_type:complete